MDSSVRQPRSRNGFERICPRLLIAWLESPCGFELREAIERELLPNLAARLFDGSEEAKALQAEVLARAGKETRCLVVIEPYKPNEAQLKVYGPRELKVKVITLPMAACPTAETQRVLEQLVEVELKPWDKELYYPAACRASETVEILSPEAALEREHNKAWGKAVIEAIKGLKK